MPTSAWDGRQWVTDRMAETNPSIDLVVDVGPGEGVNSILGRHLIWWAKWVGVEIFEPYIERFMLKHKYDEAVRADIREWPEGLGTDPYLILFGDVLEHMAHDDAVSLVRFHQERATEIYVSVPIVFSPQDACYGNDHEAHLYHWKFHEMAALLETDGWTVETFRGVQVGRYWAKRHG